VSGGRLRRWIRTFARDRRAQDLLEYALLSAVIGLVGLAVLNGVSTLVNTYYGQSQSSVNGLWQSPDPSGS
jgi:Flp pilus assembly pilin Flp